MGETGMGRAVQGIPSLQYRNVRVNVVSAAGMAVAIGSRIPMPPKSAGK